MKKLPAISLLFGMMACGGPTPPTTPEPEPVPEPATEPVPEPVPEPEAEPVVEQDEADEVEPSLPPLEPERPPCHTLGKSRCSVSPGCAWYEKGGEGHCKDE
ncbi:MAG: hypothetical protein ACOC1F_00765 [Myxococcota bacterium]